MLWKRLLVGPAMIALAALVAVFDDWLGSGWAGAPWDVWLPGVAFGLIGLFAAVMGAVELANLQRAKGVPASRVMMAGAAIVGLCSVAASGRLGEPGDAAVLLLTSGVVTLMTAVLVYGRDQRPDGMLEELSCVLLAFVFLGGQLGLYVTMRTEHSAWVVLWLVLTVKSCDVGAFFTGRSFGKTPLARWISPGKTWEGFGGGVLLAMVVGALGALGLDAAGVAGGPSVLLGGLIGLSCAIAGQSGDLVVSLLKRDAGAKDAGDSVPGFGGVLDVIDSLLLAAPVGFWLLRMSGSGAG